MTKMGLDIRREAVLVFILIIVAAFLRFFHLGSLPFGVHTDEIMNGYVGRFTLENGVDIYGNPWPILYFNNFGDYPNIVPMYLSGAATYLFGFTVFSIRAPIAAFGVLTVLLVYFIQRWLFKSQSVAFLSALILAVLPWHVVLSRATAEGITATFFFLLGFIGIFVAIDKQKIWLFLLSTIALFSTYFLYPGFRLLVPLGLLIVIWLAKGKQWKILAFSTTVMFFLLTGYISQTTWGKGRYEQTSVFTHNNVIKCKALRYSTGIGEGKVLEARIFHNKLALAGLEIMRQYSSYFSPQFLIGDAGKPGRYAISENGQGLFIIFLILFGAIGVQFTQPLSKNELIEMFKDHRAKYFLGFFWLLLISPLPAALTLEDVPNIHRAALSGVLITICLGFVISIVCKVRLPISPRIIVAGLVIVLLLETLQFWHYFALLSAKTATQYRNDELNSLAKWLVTHHAEYEHVYVPTLGALPLHYLFYQNTFDPTLAHQFREGLKIDVIDNVSFSEDRCPIFQDRLDALNTLRYAIALRAECVYPQGYERVQTIQYQNGDEAYFIVQPVQPDSPQAQ